MDYSLWIWLLPTGVNLLLDWLLIYRLHLGIAGAAWATVIAQAASFCMSVLFLPGFPASNSVACGRIAPPWGGS